MWWKGSQDTFEVIGFTKGQNYIEIYGHKQTSTISFSSCSWDRILQIEQRLLILITSGCKIMNKDILLDDTKWNDPNGDPASEVIYGSND